MFDRTPANAQEILNIAAQSKARGENLKYVICGRSGPTGKTWLCNELRKAGHDAVEISEALVGLVSYRDDKNHVLDSSYGTLNKTGWVLIVLNKPLDWKWRRVEDSVRKVRYRRVKTPRLAKE